MAQFKTPSKKATIITAAIIVVLLVIAATGTVMFLRDRGTTEAAQIGQEQVSTQSENSETQTTEQPSNEEQTTPEETNTDEVATEEGTDVAQETETQTGTSQSSTSTSQGTGTRTDGTTTTTENIQESTITRTETEEIPERLVSEDHTVGWNPMDINADIASARINPTKDDVEVIKEGDKTVVQGEVINYTITVKNHTDKKLEGIEVKDVLDDTKLDLTTLEYKTEPHETLDGNTIKWYVDIEANNEVKIEFSIKVKTSVAPGTAIENKAIANGEESKEVAITEVEEAKTSLPVSKEIKAGDSDASKAYPITGVVVTLDGTNKTVTLNAANGYKAEFTDLAKYDSEGKEITYTATESAIPGEEENFKHYKQEEPEEGKFVNTFDVTTVKDEKTSLPVSKEIKAGDSDAAKAYPITGVVVTLDGTDKTVTLNAANGYKAEFKDLAKYDSEGNKITYTATESAIPGEEENFKHYKQEEKTEGQFVNTFDVTTVQDDKTTFPVSKTWANMGSQAAKDYALSGLKITLDQTGATLELNVNNGWKNTFKDLKKYDENGKLITYTATESALNDEEQKILDKYYTKSTSGNGQFVNTFNLDTVDDKKDFEVSKEWVGIDSAAAEAHKLSGIIVTLNPTGATLELNKGNEWKGTFENLDVYAEDGSLINYTVSESAKPGEEENFGYYTQSQEIAGKFVNTFNPEAVTDTVNISGTKSWNDANNVDGNRPTEIIVTLMKVMDNGAQTAVKGVAPITVTEANGWKYEFNNLPKYDSEGNEIQYTVAESEVDKYTPEYSVDENNKYIINIENTREVKHIEATKQATEVKVKDSQTGDFVSIVDPDKFGVTIGDTVKYEIVVTNNGNTNLKDFTISDDKDVTLTKVTVPDGMDSSKVELKEYNKDTNLVEGLTGELKPGESIRLEVTYLVRNNADVQNKTELTNKVTAYANGTNTEKPEETIKITKTPRVEIEKTSTAVNGTPITDADRITVDGKEDVADVKVSIGDKITYNIVVRNTGNVTLTNVKVTDERDVTYISGDDKELFNGRNGITLEPGEEKTITVEYTVKTSDINDESNLVENIANVTAKYENEPVTPDKDNDLVTETELSSNIVVNKTSNKVGETLEYGDEITYTITAKNNSAKDGTVKVVDSKLQEAIENKYVSTPSAITVNENTTNGGNTSRTVTVEELAQGIDVKVAGGKEATIVFTVTVKAKPGTDLTNLVTVPEGGNPGDNTEVTNDVEKTVTIKEYSQTIRSKNVVLVIDLSSSMNYRVSKGSSETKLDAAKDAVRQFVEKVYANGNGKDVEMRVVTFNWGTEQAYKNSGYYHRGEDLTMVGAKYFTTINSLNYKDKLDTIDNINVPNNMSTDITAGINKAKSELNNFTNKENDNVVIFLGDGAPDTNFTGDTATKANNAATSLKRSATLYTIGFYGIDDEGHREDSTTLSGILTEMASYNEEKTKKLYYSASSKDELLESFESITSEVGKTPEVDHKQSKDGIVTITLDKQLAADQKITITDNGREQSFEYNKLPSNVKYDSTAKTITWDITGYDADAELTISYVLSK